MTEFEKTRHPTRSDRKPYVKPTVVGEQRFETLALACDKITGQFGDPCGPPNTQQS